MPDNPKTITPFRAYTVDETAKLIGLHPVVLRRKLQKNNQLQDPFIQKANPQKVGREWRFMGENILNALGSISFQNQENKNIQGIMGAASAVLVKDSE
jgi:hypothetical protein